MAALTTQSLVDAGTAPTFGAASTSDTAEVGNGINTFVVYKNGDASPHTATVAVVGNNTYGQPNPDPAYVIAAGGERWIPLRKEYADASGAGVGRCTITLDAATSVTVAVVQVG